ncbi:hypothetical protein [Pseudomonas sp. ACN5]|uniref:hypothetical protein n=1 Tax=Pseudomonas sp. ACN5 TaxID=1920427 RepID=UPI0015AAE483|nr:hypothetical protein [Pseudomonas sp. ACN5]
MLGLAALTTGALVLGKAWAALKIGRGLVNIARGSAGDRSNIVQRVFVTNADDVGGDDLDQERDRKRGKGSGTASRASRGARFMKAGGALAAVGAGLQVVDTYQNATTRDEKAEGYGEAAGSLAGGLAGAAAGAAIGSFIPLLGTAVGGMIGAWLGSMGGGDVGATMGKSLFGGPDTPAKAPIGILPMAAGQGVGAVVRSMENAPAAPVTAAALMLSTAAKTPEWPKVDQQFTFAPAPVFQVHGDVKDPAQFVQEMMPYLRRQFDDFAREARDRQLFDAPHVG